MIPTRYKWLGAQLTRISGKTPLAQAIRYARSEEGGILTEAQVQALEKKKLDDEACGEIETAHPGYLGSQDTFYVGTRIKRLRPYLDHGLLEIDNNTAERGMRAIAIGRKNWLLCRVRAWRPISRHCLHAD